MTERSGKKPQLSETVGMSCVRLVRAGKGEGVRVGVKGQGSVIEFISKQTNELRAAAAEAEYEKETAAISGK